MTNPYKPHGAAIPELLGRKQLLHDLCSLLANNNVSLVGPKLYGKTVVVHGLRDVLAKPGSPFDGVSLWDMRSRTPRTDDEFRSQFAEALLPAVKAIDPSIGEYLKAGGATPMEWAAFALDQVASAGKRVVLIIDKFHAIEISDDGIGPNLLGELRVLASEKEGFRLVVASRRPLREQCMTPEAKSSDFHRVFEKLQLGGFSEADMDEVWGPLADRGATVDKGAKTELRNWSGGVPPLVFAMLWELFDKVPGGSQITDAHVKEAALAVLTRREEDLADLWDDCPMELQTALAETATRAVAAGELRKEHQRALVVRQIGRIHSDQLQWSCGLLQHYVDPQHAGPVSALRILFGTSPAAAKNYPKVLEHLHSLSALKADDLRNEVGAALTDLKSDARKALNRARSIRDAALDLVWDSEVLAGGKLPPAWEAAWHSNTGKFLGPDWLERIHTVPDERGEQLAVLRQATGTKDLKRVTVKVSKQTYTLIAFLHEAGNLQNHRGGETISDQFARAVCSAAVELCARLQAECDA
jgi:hypothetical protein